MKVAVARRKSEEVTLPNFRRDEFKVRASYEAEAEWVLDNFFPNFRQLNVFWKRNQWFAKLRKMMTEGRLDPCAVDCFEGKTVGPKLNSDSRTLSWFGHHWVILLIPKSFQRSTYHLLQRLQWVFSIALRISAMAVCWKRENRKVVPIPKNRWMRDF